ncbi:MAG: fluoride efflux transporter CrcB [Vampirovibrionales bacterium]
MIKPFVWLFIGGGLGSLGRYFLGRGCTAALGGLWPYGTFGANLLGCLLIGLAYSWLNHHHPHNVTAKLFIITGCLGGFTTFSAFGLETWQMVAKSQAYLAAGLYAVGSVLLGLGAVVGTQLYKVV